jgi:Ala-tRNA(Pro) deacylase
MPVERLKGFLDENEVKYVTISHSEAFTAQEIAAAAHVPGKEMAKTVMVKVGDELAMVVVPAPDQVNLERLRRITGHADVEIAPEEEFSDRFPSCEVGAMPPFGNLWDMNVFVDERLRENEQIAFNAGSHTELVRLPYGDFERLVGPVVAQVSAHA